MASQQGQAFEDLRNTISECSRVVRHRWRIALLGLCTIGSVAFWWSQYLPREYSSATVFERRDDVVLQNLVASNSPYGFSHLKSTMKMDMTGSRALAQAAVRCGLLPDGTFAGEGPLSPEERNALQEILGRYKLRAAVSFLHSSSNLDTLQLSCAANDPELPSKFVVALRDNYIEQTRERIREILVGTQEFFQTEIGQIRAQLSQTEERLSQDFDEFTGIDPTDTVSVGNHLEMLRQRRDGDFDRKAELEAQIGARLEFLEQGPRLYENLAGPAATSQPAAQGSAHPPQNPFDPALEKAIQQVRAQLLELVTVRKMTMEHPAVRDLQGRLEALEDLRMTLATAEDGPELASDIVTATGNEQVSDSYRQWQTQKLRVQMELEALQRQFELASERLEASEARVQRVEGLYERLRSEHDDLRRLHEQRSEQHAELALWQNHLQRLERVLAAESGERGTQFALIEDPRAIATLIKPRLSSIFVVCLGLGLAAGALLVAVAELFDRSFRSVGQVTRSLGIPVLECISVIQTPRERRKQLLSRLIWTPTLALLLCALLTSSALAYASVARPSLHKRAMHKVNHVLDSVGLAVVSPSALDSSL